MYGVVSPIVTQKLPSERNLRIKVKRLLSPINFLSQTTIMSTALDLLKKTGTVVVSDSGDFECKPKLMTDPISFSSCIPIQRSLSTSPRYAKHLIGAVSVYSRSTQDATTNPSLILAAANKPNYQKLIDIAIEYGKSKGGDVDSQANAALDRLASHSHYVPSLGINPQPIAC